MQLATLSLFPTKGRAHLFKRKSALFEFESPCFFKDEETVHLRFPRKPEEEFKKNNNFLLLALYWKMKWGRNFEAVLNMEAASRLGKRRKEEEEETHFFSVFSP